MIAHPNALLIHHAIQAANAGDRETLRALWADDIVWHVKGTGPWQGELKGADDIFEYLAELGGFGHDGVHTEIEDVMVSNRRAAVICQTRTGRAPSALDAGFLLIATIVDRRIQRLVTVPVDEARVEDFRSDPDA